MASIFWEPDKRSILGARRRARAGRIALFAFVGLLTFLTVAAVRNEPARLSADEPRQFRLGMEGISRWSPVSADVRFSVDTAGSGDVNDDGQIDGDDVAATLAAIDAGFEVWQIAGLAYSIAPTGDPNPCGGLNRLSWAAIDGEGGVLAETNVCRDLATNEIVGFTVTFDSLDEWSTAGAGDQFDLQSMAAHEAGHVTGLDHIYDLTARGLTMFFAAQTWDRRPRTLGCGDRLGINALYGTSLSCGPTSGG